MLLQYRSFPVHAMIAHGQLHTSLNLALGIRYLQKLSHSGLNGNNWQVHILWWLAVKFRQSDIVAGLKECYCPNLPYSSIRSQSVKFPNFWINAPKWRWSEVCWLCCIAVSFLSEFHKLDHSSFLSHCAVLIRVNMSCLLSEFFSDYE
jgi:hypothetical protein